MKSGRIVKSAVRGLNKNKLRTFLMMIGIVMGITAVTMVVSIGLGAENRVMNRVKKFGLESMMVFAGGGREMGGSSQQPTTTLTIRDTEAIKLQVPGVTEVAPFNRKGDGTVKYREKSVTTRVFGVTPAWAPVWDWYAARGRFIEREDEEQMARICVIGPTLRKELMGESDPIGEQIRIANVPFEVVGIMEQRGTSPGGGDIDDRAYIPLSTFLRRVANVDYIAGIKIRLDSGEDFEQATSSIKNLLRERHKLAPGEPDDFRIIIPDEVKEFAGSVAGTFNIFLVLVAAISLIAGGFVIANIMLISISERRAEIGLRKAIGARNEDIRFQFLLEAVAVTLAGGAAGIVLGFTGALIFRTISGMPVSVSWEGVVIGIVFSAVVGSIAGIQPARKAARLEPIDALRG